MTGRKTGLEDRMRRLNVFAVLALTGIAVGACAAHPIVARDPVPPPSPEAAYDCDSNPSLLNAYHTRCEPRERAPVLRARG